MKSISRQRLSILSATQLARPMRRNAHRGFQDLDSHGAHHLLSFDMGKALAKIALGEPELADDDWAERCLFWLSAAAVRQRPLRYRRQTHEPLVLTGHGMRLCIEHGALVVRNGFTHYPQRVEEHRFFRGDRILPSRIIVIDGSGTLSFDVLSWLSEQSIPLIRISWRGEVVTALGRGQGVNSKQVAVQLDAQRDGRRLHFAISLIREKIRNSIGTLDVAVPKSAASANALAKLQREASELDKRHPKTIPKLLAIEGRAAFAYFNAWQSLPLRWSGTARHPIPQDWYQVGQRQSFARKKGRNRNASHPLNAILNYAYAVLESQARIEVVAAGFDPSIGFLHASGLGRPAFVLDLMEPLRPLVDRKVLEFVQGHTFHPADFTIRSDGVCRLNPEMARNVTKRIELDFGLKFRCRLL